MSGTLHVVATPIGHLGDLTPRAAEVLGQVDLVAAEDTRRTGRLLAHLGLERPLVSFHDHSGAARLEQVLSALAQGRDVALVSDAGTPLINDPGFELVRAARQQGYAVVPVPGPSSVIAALSVAGLPTDRFTCHGFPPVKSAAREHFIKALAAAPGSQVLLESAQRIGPLLDQMVAILGQDRPAFIGREMTKLHEQYVAGSLGELAAAVASGAIPARGELVLVLGPAAGPTPDEAEAEARRLLAALVDELPASRAARIAARLTGLPRQRCYDIAQSLRSG